MNKVLIYLGHPAQYHFFKNTIRILKENKDTDIKLLIKTKDILEDLCQEDGIDYENIQPSFRNNNKYSILFASLKRTFKVYRIARLFKADILIGTDSSIAQAAWLLRKPSLTVLEDDIDIIRNLAILTYPFTKAIVVPEVCNVGKWEAKKVPYQGYMKLAYLHPNYYTPQRQIIEDYDLPEKYVLVRLARLTAHHDAGIKGLKINTVTKIIEIAGRCGYATYISSEINLPPNLVKYRLPIKHSDIHHVMNYASLIISDSQSMSVEAAMLGVPSLRFSDFTGRISVLEELEQIYHLTLGIKTDEENQLFEETESLLSMPHLKEQFLVRRKAMLNDKIDVTAFFVWLISGYPGSIEIIRKNPNIQHKFK